MVVWQVNADLIKESQSDDLNVVVKVCSQSSLLVLMFVVAQDALEGEMCLNVTYRFVFAFAVLEFRLCRGCVVVHILLQSQCVVGCVVAMARAQLRGKRRCRQQGSFMCRVVCLTCVSDCGMCEQKFVLGDLGGSSQLLEAVKRCVLLAIIFSSW